MHKADFNDPYKFSVIFMVKIITMAKFNWYSPFLKNTIVLTSVYFLVFFPWLIIAWFTAVWLLLRGRYSWTVQCSLGNAPHTHEHCECYWKSIRTHTYIYQSLSVSPWFISLSHSISVSIPPRTPKSIVCVNQPNTHRQAEWMKQNCQRARNRI